MFWIIQLCISGSAPSFTGNISEWEWTRDNTTDAYSLEYDALSRITGSRLFRNGNPVDALSESGISYDSNGNILSLTRTGEDGSAVNDLSYHYDGNRLTSLSDGDIQFQNYAYDADGNMTFDGRTGMSLTWNDLGLVKKVSLNDTDLVNYSYLADGTKVSAQNSDGDGLLYLGSLIYRKTGSNISLESAGFAGGRFVARETSPGVSSMVPMIHVTDHLGSVRAVVDGTSGEVVETNDYYPFGSRWDVVTSLKDDSNRFRYNSKEEQFRFGTPYIDYGARQYDPVLGRWFAQDPLAEQAYDFSPYVFCSDNPVNNYDPNGKWDIKVSAMDDRGSAPYAIMTVTNRSGETIYKTVVKVTGQYRDRARTNADTPVGKYDIIEWRRTGEGTNYPSLSFGPNDLLALHYVEGEGGERDGMHLHGGRSQVELSNTNGCIRIADEDIAELKELTDALEASDPEERKGMLFVENDLTNKVVYQDRESIKYDWERYMGELPAAVVTPNN